MWGGDADHIHDWETGTRKVGGGGGAERSTLVGTHDREYKDGCADTSSCVCGAWRGALGLEPTPALFIAHLVDVMREVRRVLKPSGTAWVNMGDSFAGSTMNGGPKASSTLVGTHHTERPGARFDSKRELAGLKPKDKCLIPHRLGIALQEPYHTGRIKAEQDRVWMAAMLDAEGTICGFRHERPDGNVRTGCLVFITNTSERVLNECDRIWPGARYIEHNKAGDHVMNAVATRDCWRWQIQSAERRSLFLREIYPYLVEKRVQAILGYNLAELAVAAKKLGRGGETKQVKERRDELAVLLSRANAREDVTVPKWCVEPPSVLEPGWYVRMDNIWAKSNPMPESVTDRPTQAHEFVWFLTKGERYYYDADAIREPAAWERWGDQTTDKYAGSTTKTGWMESGSRDDIAERVGKKRRTVRDGIDTNGGGQGSGEMSYPLDSRNKRSVWSIPTAPFPLAHFATFPPALVKPCILAGSPEGGTVLDPFVGSGTTAMVAKEFGRKAIGIDLNPEYLEMARRRCAQMGLFEVLP